ncbi:MAG: DEAD/DEAH box helicase, partial [Actinomycetota bacterium]
RHLLAEAPTGSGKSLAYLSAAVASGRRVVVATSTIALQAQLIEKDLLNMVHVFEDMKASRCAVPSVAVPPAVVNRDFSVPDA